MNKFNSFVKVFLLFTGIFFIQSCKQETPRTIFKVKQEFLPYVSGFSGGVISSNSEIKVKLAFEPQGLSIIDDNLTQKLFEIKPEIKGKAYWVDATTVAFKPENLLKYGETFHVKFNMGKLLPMPEDLKVFEFNFMTPNQSAEITTEGFVTNESNDNYSLSGTIFTADFAGIDTIKKAFKVLLNQKELNEITWSHSLNNTKHQFTIHNIIRESGGGKLELSLDAKTLGTNNDISSEEYVPEKGVFKVIKTLLVNENENHVVVWFSDQLMQNQDLDGLINTDRNYNMQPGWSIEKNILKIFPSDTKNNFVYMSLSHAIKNSAGKTLGKDFSLNLQLNDEKPSVNFIGKETITPTDQGAMVYFNASHLKAVDVKILKIYESNIPQFLQTEDLNGGYNLIRVGKVIKKTTVQLPIEEYEGRRTQTTHALKLDDLIKSEPGAIYRITLSFKPEYSTYPCPDKVSSGNTLTKIEKEQDDEEDYSYNRYHHDEYDYDYDDYYEYDWTERNNPCSPSFFRNSNTASKNILASNVALTAKIGNDRKMYVFASDIITAKPILGANVQVLDYQQQSILTGTTDNNGQYQGLIPEKTKPFLITASANNQKAYIKIDEYRALSTSNFEVSGVELKEGIKGYIYGERGVWRPGDTLFLSYAINDKENPLPLSYPIVMELMNPKWQVVYKTVVPKVKDQSLYAFRIPTDPDAITGNYTAKVTVGNQSITKNIKVETIMPNRLKIDVKYKGEYLSVKDGNDKLSMFVKWLHGSPAPGLKTIVNATLQPVSLHFDQHKAFNFNNPISRYNADEINIFDGYLDREGKAEIPVKVGDAKNMPPKLNMNINVRVFEQGGAFSVDRFSVPYFVYKTYTGIKVPEGKGYNNALDVTASHKLEFITVDEKGKAVANQDVNVRIYKLDYQWWWQINHNNASNLFDSESTDLVVDETLKTNANGLVSYNLKVDPKAYGKYFVSVTHFDGHVAGRMIELDDRENNARMTDQAKRNANQLSFDDLKASYQVGEQVEVNIPAPEGSQVLVCLENFRGLQKFEWVKSGKSGVKYKFKVEEDMAPNIYFNATIIQPYRDKANDLPIRRYGVAPIMIENPKSHLHPLITAPEQTRPDTKVKISVAEKNNQAMEYTLAIVDEGLLDLTRFKTPNPWNEMYAKTAYGVKTWDFYEMIVGTFSGRLESVASIGGDDEGSGAKGSAKANRFKPMVKFLGPFKLEKGKKADHTVHIPEYIGSARIMVVASNNNNAYGSAQKDIQISQPLMILATMPRMISPGEEFNVPVSVFFDGKTVKNAKVSIAHNNMFTNKGQKEVNIKYIGEREEMAYFTLKSANETGIGKVKVTATSGNEKSVHEIEIDLRAPNPPVIIQEELMVDAGKTAASLQNNDFISGTGTYWVELSSIPPINLKSRIRYLIQYPHGCIEQTTSGAFPQLYLKDLMEISDYETKQIDKNIKAAINRIYKFQTGSGGLSYWPGSSTDEPYATSYAGHFLIEAVNKGYQVNKGFIEKWKKYQKEAAKRFGTNYNNSNYYNNDDIIQAYRLYTLALAGNPDYASMNKLRERKGLSIMASWRLAATYQLAGQKEAALRLMSNLSTTSSSNSNSHYYTYGSRDRDDAVIIEALTLMEQKHFATPLIKKLSEELKSDKWMSTQTTAYALMAISKYLGGEKLSTNITADIIVNGKTTSVKSGKPFLQFDIEKPGKKVDIKLLNKGKSTIFARVVSTGIPPAKETQATQSNLVMSVQFMDNEGKSIDWNKLAQSTDFIAEVTLKNPGIKGEYTNLALTAMFASGFEIANARMDESINNGSSFDYQDIRDDRVLTYFSLSKNQSKTFRFRLNATYAGKFFLPAIQCEAMYDNSISATSSGKWIEVKKIENMGGI